MAVRLWASNLSLRRASWPAIGPVHRVSSNTSPRELGARDAQELDVRAGDEVLRPDAQDEQPDNRWGRLVYRRDHFGRRQPFLRGPVVCGELFPVEGSG